MRKSWDTLIGTTTTAGRWWWYLSSLLFEFFIFCLCLLFSWWLALSTYTGQHVYSAVLCTSQGSFVTQFSEPVSSACLCRAGCKRIQTQQVPGLGNEAFFYLLEFFWTYLLDGRVTFFQNQFFFKEPSETLEQVSLLRLSRLPPGHWTGTLTPRSPERGSTQATLKNLHE